MSGSYFVSVPLPEMGRVAAATIHSFPSVVPNLGSGSAEAFLASSTLQDA